MNVSPRYAKLEELVLALSDALNDETIKDYSMEELQGFKKHIDDTLANDKTFEGSLNAKLENRDTSYVDFEDRLEREIDSYRRTLLTTKVLDFQNKSAMSGRSYPAANVLAKHMQRSNLSALRIDHKAACTGFIPAPDVEDSRLQEALNALFEHYDRVTPETHYYARLGGLEVVDPEFRNHKDVLHYFLILNPNNIYYLKDQMFLPENEWMLDLAVSYYANPESYLMHFDGITEKPDGPQAQLFVKYLIKGGRLPLVLQALDWNVTKLGRLLLRERGPDDLGGHTTVPTTLRRDGDFHARTKAIFELCVPHMRKRQWNKQFPFDFTNSTEPFNLLRIHEFREHTEPTDGGTRLGENVLMHLKHLGKLPQDKEFNNSQIEYYEFLWYHRLMAMALVRIINAIPEAATCMLPDKVPRVYTVYMCLEEMERQQNAVAKNVSRDAGAFTDVIPRLDYVFLHAHRVFMFLLAEQPLKNIRDLALEGPAHFPTLRQDFPATKVVLWAGRLRQYLTINDCKHFKTLLRYCCTNKLWEAHKEFICKHDSLLQIVVERLLKWALPDRTQQDLLFFSSPDPDGLHLIEPTESWDYKSCIEVLSELIQSVVLSGGYLKIIQARLAGITDFKAVTRETASEIHRMWRQLHITLQIAKKYEDYRKRVNEAAEEMNGQLQAGQQQPLLEDPAGNFSFLQLVYDASNTYQFFGWYESTLSMLKMKGSPVDVGADDFDMMQVARIALENDDTFSFVVDEVFSEVQI